MWRRVMLSFIMLEDFEGMPVIIRVDRIEHIYSYTEPVDGAEEQDEVKTAVVLIRPEDPDKDDDADEIVVKASPEKIYSALANLGDVSVTKVE
jgi:hypothetical protein